MNYREKWYAERGLPYEPPKLVDCPPMRCVGRAEWVKVPPRKTEREPGDDDDQVTDLPCV